VRCGQNGAERLAGASNYLLIALILGVFAVLTRPLKLLHESTLMN
jgi:hypothetical protein